MKQSAVALKLAGAAALAGSTQAYGDIVSLTLPTDIQGQTNMSSPFDEFWNIQTGATTSSQDSGSDFKFSYFNGPHNGNPEFFTSTFGLKPGNLPAAYLGGYGASYAYAVPQGGKIGSDTFAFEQAGAKNLAYLTETYGGIAYSPQQGDTNEYLAFQFTGADGLIHNGWIELDSETYASSSSPGGLVFLGGAYNTIADGQPGGDILAGELTVPEPGTISSLVLGAAALGAVGLMRRRRLNVSVS